MNNRNLINETNEDIIRVRGMVNRNTNTIIVKRTRTNTDLQDSTQKNKARTAQAPSNRDELRCS